MDGARDTVEPDPAPVPQLEGEDVGVALIRAPWPSPSSGWSRPGSKVIVLAGGKRLMKRSSSKGFAALGGGQIRQHRLRVDAGAGTEIDAEPGLASSR